MRASLVMALASPLNATEDYIIAELPLARAYQYIAERARAKNARIVWPNSYETPEEKLSMVRALLPAILRQNLGSYGATTFQR